MRRPIAERKGSNKLNIQGIAVRFRIGPAPAAPPRGARPPHGSGRPPRAPGEPCACSRRLPTFFLGAWAGLAELFFLRFLASIELLGLGFCGPPSRGSCSAVARWIPVGRPSFESSGSLLSIPVLLIRLGSLRFEISAHHRGASPQLVCVESARCLDRAPRARIVRLSFEGLLLRRRSMDSGRTAGI